MQIFASPETQFVDAHFQTLTLEKGFIDAAIAVGHGCLELDGFPGHIPEFNDQPGGGSPEVSKAFTPELLAVGEIVVAT